MFSGLTFQYTFSPTYLYFGSWKTPSHAIVLTIRDWGRICATCTTYNATLATWGALATQATSDLCIFFSNLWIHMCFQLKNLSVYKFNTQSEKKCRKTNLTPIFISNTLKGAKCFFKRFNNHQNDKISSCLDMLT
jgi:hypothetical protein